MQDFEKLGVFYLGKKDDGLLLLDSKDLVTHAVCVGMTGSGKTGLCVGLLEEAAIDGIPPSSSIPKAIFPISCSTSPPSPRRILPPGSTKRKPAKRASPRTSSPPKPPSAGRRGSPIGDRTVPASNACATRLTTPSTPPVPPPATPSACSAPSARLRRKCAKTVRPCANGFSPPPPPCSRS